jgi:hypothetical protein
MFFHVFVLCCSGVPQLSTLNPQLLQIGQAGVQWPASRSLGEGWSLGKVLPLRFLGVGQT